VKFFRNKIFVDGRIFVTAVREEGVPASLMTISEKKGSTFKSVSRLVMVWEWEWLQRQYY